MAGEACPELHQLRSLTFPDDLRLLVLFGSRARGEAHGQSDWDFGWLGPRSFDDAAFLADLTATLRTDHVDLVDLSRASGLLRYRAARDGVPVHEAAPGVFQAFQIEAAQFWCDTELVLRSAYKDALASLRG